MCEEQPYSRKAARKSSLDLLMTLDVVLMLVFDNEQN